MKKEDRTRKWRLRMLDITRSKKTKNNSSGPMDDKINRLNRKLNQKERHDVERGDYEY